MPIQFCSSSAALENGSTKFAYTKRVAPCLRARFISSKLKHGSRIGAWLSTSLALVATLTIGFDASAAIERGRKIDEGLFQMTGTKLKPGYKARPGEEMPDPAPPFVTKEGYVEIYGSSLEFIRYKNWKEFLSAGEYERIRIDLRSPNGAGFPGAYTHPWDLRRYRLAVPSNTGPTKIEEIVLGGAMNPKAPNKHPVWPDDNPSRRIYTFRANGNPSDGKTKWTRDVEPVAGSNTTGWYGHSYGGNFFQDTASDDSTIDTTSSDPVYFFFEQVDQSITNTPYRTQIYSAKTQFQLSWVPVGAAEMFDVLKKGFSTVLDMKARLVPSTATPTLALGVTNPETGRPFPSTIRSVGGYLVEGPRPVRVEIQGRVFYIIGFSAGDFCTDGYTINYAWSRSIQGPYQPILNDTGTDFVDFGKRIRDAYGLSWMGRPVLYQLPGGSYEMMFHAVDKKIILNNDYTRWPTEHELSEFYRMLFRAPVELSLGPDLSPRIELKAKRARVSACDSERGDCHAH